METRQYKLLLITKNCVHNLKPTCSISGLKIVYTHIIIPNDLGVKTRSVVWSTLIVMISIDWGDFSAMKR
jgi:hypothetical protein